MLLFNQHSEPDTDFEREFLRLSSLVADMDHIRLGVPPVAIAGDDVPLLDRWLLGNVLTPALVGLSTGHPALPGTNRPIATSQVLLMSADISWALSFALVPTWQPGRAAEEVMLETLTVNAGGADHSDLALATRLALDMETILGIGGKYPLVHRKPGDATEALAADPELAARVNERLERAYQVACTIVREQTDAIDFLAEQLFEAGTLDGPELDAVLAETRKRIRERPG